MLLLVELHSAYLTKMDIFLFTLQCPSKICLGKYHFHGKKDPSTDLTKSVKYYTTSSCLPLQASIEKAQLLVMAMFIYFDKQPLQDSLHCIHLATMILCVS